MTDKNSEPRPVTFRLILVAHVAEDMRSAKHQASRDKGTSCVLQHQSKPPFLACAAVRALRAWVRAEPVARPTCCVVRALALLALLAARTRTLLS